MSRACTEEEARALLEGLRKEWRQVPPAADLRRVMLWAADWTALLEAMEGRR